LAFISGYLLKEENCFIEFGILLLLELLAIVNFIQFLNKTNKKINFFIQAIKNDDTTLRFPLKTGNSIINELHQSLNELNVILQQTKVKSQIKERYFSEILQNIATGVMVVNEKGFVTDVNHSTLELMGLQTLTHLAQINRIDPEFKTGIEKVTNHQKQVLVLHRSNETIQVIVRCSVINLKDEKVKLITMQDIRGELERKEIDSWVKLIRVLSHEIMNSLAPVTSIAQSLKDIWKKRIDNDLAVVGDDDVEKTIGGLDVIGERGEGLIRFVQSYRLLTKAPQPILKDVDTQSLIDSLNILVSPFKEHNNLTIQLHYPDDNFTIKVDGQMLIQVIINLVKNSVEALKDKADAKVDVYFEKHENNGVVIKVEDNGPGISKSIKDEIFVPFFTTKNGGTGVGLSYSRQMIRAHGGTLNCYSEAGRTVFKIVV
jgi:nitrogen fixation/metabolism regulation signal transduction histidine kinase